MKNHVFRVHPNQELMQSIKDYCRQNNITSALIGALIGSVTEAELAFLKTLPANYITKKFEGPLEIAAAQGSVALCDNELVIHIHILLSDENTAVGGHLNSARIFSTAEVTIQPLERQLQRATDPTTGLKELKDR